MCVYGSLWAFADTRVGAPVVEAAHHPDFFVLFFIIIIIIISGCVVWGYKLWFCSFPQMTLCESFPHSSRTWKTKESWWWEQPVRTCLEAKKKMCLCLSVFFLRPAVSLITDRFTPAAHVSRLVLFPTHLDQHFLWHSPLSQQRKAVSWWMVKSH